VDKRCTKVDLWKEVRENDGLKDDIALTALALLYIGFFVSLNCVYDWDTVVRMVNLKNGILGSIEGVTHFLVSIIATIPVKFGLDPLSSFKLVTFLFGIVVVLAAYKLAYRESKDRQLAILTALFLLFNAGFTFLVTTLEDNIMLEAFVALFALLLLKERWFMAALAFSIGTLVHVQMELFLPMLILYGLLKLDLSSLIRDPGQAASWIKAQITPAVGRTDAVTTLGLLPLVVAYTYLLTAKGWTLFGANHGLVTDLTASGAAYHGDPALWFFISGKSPQEWVEWIYTGFTSTFVCHYPGFLKSMPKAPIFGAVLLVLVAYLFIAGLCLNAKTLCAIPTYLVLMVHLSFFEPWNAERWDFFPFMIVYFVAVGYVAKGDVARKRLKWALALAVIFSAMFTFSSYNSFCSFGESKWIAYADELPKVLDNQSTVLEMNEAPNSWLGYYLRYRCGDKVLFPDNDTNLTKIFMTTKVFSSQVCCNTLNDTTLNATLAKQIRGQMTVNTIWVNEVSADWNIMKLKLNVPTVNDTSLTKKVHSSQVSNNTLYATLAKQVQKRMWVNGVGGDYNITKLKLKVPDELPKVLDNQSAVLEINEAPNSWLGYYLRY
jgi:hypothetical protein